ncbi:hypothetical protein J1N35_042103 [Gossypium stocksii]|uniref:Uncharacterized protein n=1 Tax=Gossypium stocksii TaxID=47602 RepID=A0A9D3ZJ83_9ROSI|nr:hypothetical protein J1N35_042103 [Gossypium stocksii]
MQNSTTASELRLFRFGIELTEYKRMLLLNMFENLTVIFLVFNVTVSGFYDSIVCLKVMLLDMVNDMELPVFWLAATEKQKCKLKIHVHL